MRVCSNITIGYSYWFVDIGINRISVFSISKTLFLYNSDSHLSIGKFENLLVAMVNIKVVNNIRFSSSIYLE